MNIKTLFALGVRILGLVFLYHAFQAAVAAISILLNGTFVEPWLQFSFRISIFQCLAYGGFSLWLIGGATSLCHWAFREPQVHGNPQPEHGLRCVRCDATLAGSARFCPDCGWTQPHDKAA